MFARGEGGNHEGRVGKQHVAGDRATDTAGVPKVADRTTFEAELGRLRVREKAHTHEGDAIAAARRRLPMVEVDPHLTLFSPDGPLSSTVSGERRPSRKRRWCRYRT
jgi:hypothetical protein